MGTLVREIVPGVNCGHWDPPAETPSSLYCMFWDVKKGDRGGAREPPNGHLFRLDQVVGSPCDFKYINLAFGWEVTFWLQAALMGVILQDAILRDNTYFYDTEDYPPLPEYRVFNNEFITPVNNWGWNGHCVIYWMSIVIVLTEAFGLDDIDDLMLETFPVNAGEFVIKLCSLTLGTNARFKISP